MSFWEINRVKKEENIKNIFKTTPNFYLVFSLFAINHNSNRQKFVFFEEKFYLCDIYFDLEKKMPLNNIFRYALFGAESFKSQIYSFREITELRYH